MLGVSVHKISIKGTTIHISQDFVGEDEYVVVSRNHFNSGHNNCMKMRVPFRKMVSWGHEHLDYPIEDYFPELSLVERKFLLTGMTEQEQKQEEFYNGNDL